MKEYTIHYESEWISHYGSTEASGTGTVVLTDDQAESIIRLARKKDTADVEQMQLRQEHPDIYDILDKAHRELAHKTEVDYWTWDSYLNGNYDCDMHEFMDYCKENLGFTFEPDEEMDEDAYEEMEVEAFQNWLDDYVGGLDPEECRTFFIEHMGMVIDSTFEPDGYEVTLPNEILEVLGM